MLALLPDRQVDDVPPLLRIGAEFLHSHRAEVLLSAGTGAGRIIIPNP
jgi:hypothetical protein